MSLWMDLEQMCQTLKHAELDEYDWQGVRSLLRRCQDYLSNLDDLGPNATVTLPLDAVIQLADNAVDR